MGKACEHPSVCGVRGIDVTSIRHGVIRSAVAGGVNAKHLVGYFLIEYLFQRSPSNRTVLLITRHWPPVRFAAAWASREPLRDGASQAKAHGGDRPRNVSLHRAQPRAGGRFRVGQALVVEWGFFYSRIVAPA